MVARKKMRGALSMNTPRTQMVSPRPQLAINTQSTRNQRNQRNQRAPKWRGLDRSSQSTRNQHAINAISAHPNGESSTAARWTGRC